MSLPLFCIGQIKGQDYQGNINYNNIIEINGLIYNSLDTTLITGKVVRYNKNNVAKKYFSVSKGKPNDLGWVYLKDDVEMPKESVLGEVLSTGAFITGVVMAVTGNDIDLPLDDSYRSPNPIRNHISKQNESVSNAYEEMIERNDISIKLNSVKEISDGPYVEYHKDGQIRIKGNYIEDKKNGNWEEYYDSGQLMSKGNYINGIKDDLWEEFYENSQLMSIGSYKDGHVIGEWNFYDEDGHLILKENY